MSDTVKFSTFCGQPMVNKPVVDIPGVGHVTASKLRRMDYIKATDLYNRLKKLNFDEKKFKVWMTLNCKGAKVSTIYKALMDWHAQYGEQQSGGSENEEEESAQRRPAARTSCTPAKRSRNSVQFDLTGTERDDSSSVNDFSFSTNTNPLTVFFASFTDSCKNISPEFHTDLKMDILSIVSKYEKKSRERRTEPVASPSHSMNGA